MKKLFFSGCFILLATLAANSQELPGIGFVSQEEIDLKQCSFDKDANSVILVHEAISDYDDEHRLITVHHIKIKILKDGGKEDANISIPFYRKDQFEYISDVEGVTINIADDGTITKEKLDRKSIFTKETNERIGEVVFALPAVKKGSIIEYKYRSVMKHYGGLEDWYFQERTPVILSKYQLGIIPNMEFAYQVSKKEDREVIITPDKDHGRISFEMKNIPGLQNEPYMDARKDYLQKITFQLSGYSGNYAYQKKYMTSWDAVSSELLAQDYFGGQLKKNIDAGEIMSAVKLMPLHEDKMRAVYNYVRSNMSWNGLYSKYASEGLKNAWKKRSGTSGDINLLLVNLLNEAGLEANPILVSERFHGRVNVDYPFIEQFNSVFACVDINGKRYYLDATDLFCPAHITPSDILNSIGFIVKKKSGGLINIINESLMYKENINVSMEIKADGTVSGDATIDSEDYARMDKSAAIKRNAEQFKKNYFANEGVTFTINKLDIKNQENDSLPLNQQLEFTGNLDGSGDYKYIPLNFFNGFRNNPFLSDNRFSNINFGYKRNISLAIQIKLPTGYIVDNLPRSIRMVTPDREISYTRQLVQDTVNNSIVCNMNIDFKSSLYMADEYAALKEIYKKLFDYLKEPVLLKKK